jgi:hypothetical protein
MRIRRARVVLLGIVISLVIAPYVLLHLLRFIDSNADQTLYFAEEAPVLVTVTVRRAMYLGSSYEVRLTLTAVSRRFQPEMLNESESYKAYARRVLAKARCKLDAPDYSVVEVTPKTEREHKAFVDERGIYSEYIWDCGFVVSPKITGQPMLLVSVSDISGFDSAIGYESPLFVLSSTKLHDLHLPVNVPVDDRPSLTMISAPLAIIVALAGIFITGKTDRTDDDPTQRLLRQIAKARKDMR